MCFPIGLWKHLIIQSQFSHTNIPKDIDFYCNNGSWSSRTKLLAMKLLEIGETSGNDFVLFCDTPYTDLDINYGSSLNYFYNSLDTDPDLSLLAGTIFDNN